MKGISPMVAVILAGGRGTRLRPFTISIPKPLLPLGDLPIIEVVLTQLAAAGFRRVVVTLGHLPHLFTATIGDGSRWGLRIEYCREEEPLGTAGPLRLIPELSEDFLVMNGDLLTTLDYQELAALHRSRGAWGTIALHKREVRIDYGVVELDSKGRLRDYIEKPTIPYAVSMGVNVLSRRSLDFIPGSGKFDMPQLMLAMQRAGKPVYGVEVDCYWQDIGRFDDYEQASADFRADPAKYLRSMSAVPR
jgi:NDP-sugar pyrophosphorylase family protein